MQVFNHPNFGKIRGLEINGAPWLVSLDVAMALKYSNAKAAIDAYVAEENQLLVLDATTAFINKFGVYSLVRSSSMPEVNQVERWIFDEILPSICGEEEPPDAVETPADTRLQIFNNPRFGKVRTIKEGDKVLFCGSDVARALGYKEPHKAVARHCRYGTKRTVPHPQNPEKQIEMSFIPEGDVYRLGAKSELPGAEDFESWIFDEVLPTIRKTGGYGIPSTVPSDGLESIVMVLSSCVAALEKRVAAMENQTPTFTTLATETVEADGIMSSLEVARILERDHNNVLKKIRLVIEQARFEGAPVDEYFLPAYRKNRRNVRFPYYCMTEMGITLFCRSIRDWGQVEKLKAAFREKNG